ncbi:MAG: hypothetical protein VX810_00375 [Bacteroidota bacterium]|nr:hypothetical protein [Bacteroidota bacterium]
MINKYIKYYKKNNILTINQDAKTSKGTKKGYLTAILYLSPFKLSGKNLCSFATPGCIATCLNIAGRGKFTAIQKARLKRSLFYLNHKQAFMINLINRIQNFIKSAENKGLIPVVRLNGTSDIPFENIRIKTDYDLLKQGVIKLLDDTRIGAYYNIMQLFPGIQFYDYTKYPLNKRNKSNLNNYDLTFSLAENNWNDAKYYLDNKAGRVSAVFSHNVPKTYKGYKVVNGDKTDLRFLEPKGVIVGLKFKGTIIDRIKGINSGFVIYNDNKNKTWINTEKKGIATGYYFKDLNNNNKKGLK